MVELKDENDEIIAFCVEIHDVAVSKLMAGREKDYEFLQSAFLADYLEIEIFVERLRLILSSPFSNALLPRLQNLIGKFENEINLRNILNGLKDFEREIKKMIKTKHPRSHASQRRRKAFVISRINRRNARIVAPNYSITNYEKYFKHS